MPDQERKYGTKITTAGATLITTCILAGTKLKITQAAAGDGGGSYYVPSTEQTELVRELWRGPIVSAEQNPTVPNMMDVKIIVDDSVGNFTVREMGLFDENGTLIAICNVPDTEKVAISTGVDGRLTMLMHIVVVDSSVLEFTITPSLDTVSPEDLALAIFNLQNKVQAEYLSRTQLGQPNGAASLDGGGKLPATQLPAVIDCGVWGALPEDVAAHNMAPMAHQALIVDGNNVNGVDASQTLEEHMVNPYAHQNLIVDGNNT